MADYLISGKKGNGKTLYAVSLIRDALRSGRRVATNLDIRPECFGRPNCRNTIIRLPDKPTVADFEAMGRGQAGVSEDDNGYLILDETSTFFNTRTFGDKARQPMLDWLVHSRKLGWDVFYIAQGSGQIDKQIRDSGIEYHIRCGRTDKWSIPFITEFSKSLGYRIGFPKLHFGVMRQGLMRDSMFCGRRWYRGRDLYEAYDTQQVFLDREHPQACGMHTVLSAYLLKGRYMSWWQRTKPALAGAAMAGAVVGAFATSAAVYAYQKKSEPADVFETSAAKQVLGTVADGGANWMLLADGSKLTYYATKEISGSPYYLHDKTWYRGHK